MVQKSDLENYIKKAHFLEKTKKCRFFRKHILIFKGVLENGKKS